MHAHFLEEYRFRFAWAMRLRVGELFAVSMADSGVSWLTKLALGARLTVALCCMQCRAVGNTNQQLRSTAPSFVSLSFSERTKFVRSQCELIMWALIELRLLTCVYCRSFLVRSLVCANVRSFVRSLTDCKSQWATHSLAHLFRIFSRRFTRAQLLRGVQRIEVCHAFAHCFLHASGDDEQRCSVKQ